MTFTSPSPSRHAWLLVALLVPLAACSAIFDGHEYLSADAATTDASSDAATDTAPPDPCAGACGGATAICEPTGPSCVECLVDHDCTGGLGACASSHTCVACSADNTTACTGDTPVCDVVHNTCVPCNANADCPDSAPVCTDHACGRCTGEVDCAERVGAAACDGSSGACVQCTTSADCGGNACKSDHTCSAYASGAQSTCQPCDSDDNCVSMHRCVSMDYMGASHGNYCLKLASAGCMQPYSVASSATSLGGQAGPYCGIDEEHATCEAVRGLIANATCPTGDDAECGDAGLCRTVGVLSQRCTYECVGPAQCDRTGLPGSTCGSGGTGGVSYCGG